MFFCLFISTVSGFQSMNLTRYALENPFPPECNTDEVEHESNHLHFKLPCAYTDVFYTADTYIQNEKYELYLGNSLTRSPPACILDEE
jgi:hypothetical protein